MILKIVPSQRYDLNSLEAWLEELAAEGLFPEYLDSLIGRFVKGAPKKLRYSFYPSQDPFRLPREAPPAMMLELFASAGWTYALSTAEFYIFSSDDMDAPALYSDEDSKAQVLKNLGAAQRRRILIPVILYFTAFSIVLLYKHLSWDSVFYTNAPLRLLGSLLCVPFMFWLALILVIVSEILIPLRLRKLIKAVENGEVPPRRRNAKALHTALVIFSVVTFAVLAIHTSQRLDSAQIPALSELRTLGSSDPELVYKREGFNIIAPQQFSGSLHAKVPWLADSEEYRLAEPVFSPSVTIRYYRLTFRSLVPFFSRYSLEMLRLVNLDWSYTDIDVPGTDHAVFAEAAYHSDEQMLLLTKGRSLIVFRYIGKEDLRSDADIFVEMLGLPELIRGK